MKLQASSTSAWRLLAYVSLLAFIASVQVVTAEEADPLQGPLRFNYPPHLNKVLKGDLKASLHKDNDGENQEAQDFDDIEKDDEDVIGDDDMTEDDLQDIREAKRSMQNIKMEAETRDFPLPGSTTYFTDPDDYAVLFSHDTVGDTRYPNGISNIYYFIKSSNVSRIGVYCPFFKIQFSRRCQKDKFGIFKGPGFGGGVRRCGQIHDFAKEYDTSIKIVFKTNASVRKAGFICIAYAIVYPATTTTAIMPGRANKPVERNTKIVVNSCDDVIPGYACTCDPIDPGLCIKCEICTASDMEFFAVHDFSAAKLYVLMDYNCPENPINASQLTYGHENYVFGYVQCYPAPDHVILPTYPNANITFLTVCPELFDSCAAMEAKAQNWKWMGNALEGPSSPVLPSTRRNKIKGPFKNDLASLESLHETDTNVHVIGVAVDLSTFPYPGKIKVLHVQDTAGDMFKEGSNVDMSAFTSLEKLKLGLQLTELPSKSVIIKSANIASIIINLPNAEAADIASDAIRYDTNPSGSVTVQITP